MTTSIVISAEVTTESARSYRVSRQIATPFTVWEEFEIDFERTRGPYYRVFAANSHAVYGVVTYTL